MSHTDGNADDQYQGEIRSNVTRNLGIAGKNLKPAKPFDYRRVGQRSSTDNGVDKMGNNSGKKLAQVYPAGREWVEKSKTFEERARSKKQRGEERYIEKSEKG